MKNAAKAVAARAAPGSAIDTYRSANTLMPLRCEYANKPRGCKAHQAAIKTIAEKDGAGSTGFQCRQRAKIHAPMPQAATRRILNELPNSNHEGSGAKTCFAASRFMASAEIATGSKAKTKPADITMV